MTLKEWLDRARTMESELKQLQMLKDKAYILACGGSSNISGEKVQTSKNNSAERKFAAYANYSKQVDDMTSELIQCRSKLLNTLNQLKNHTYKTLLIERYINCQTWEEIARNMNYSESWIYKLHEQALTECASIKNKGKYIKQKGEA